MSMERRNLIAQWAFNTSPILGRFHLWLEDVEERWVAADRRRRVLLRRARRWRTPSS